MQNIHFHITYLLTQHECVTVPGLGAFIVYQHDKEKASRWGILSPPEKLLKFDSELKHDDKLLVNSIVKEKKCSEDEAYTLIDLYINQVLDSFDEGNKVHIPWVGYLYSSNDEIKFKPERNLSCNALNFGLTGFSLPLLQDIQQETIISPPIEKKETVLVATSPKRRIFAYAGSIAAALIAACIIPTPLNDGIINPAHQLQANLINLPVRSPVIEEEEDISNENEDEQEIITQTPEDTFVSPIEEPFSTNTFTVNQARTAVTYYYVVVSSWQNETFAKKAAAEFRSRGFENTDILYTDRKYRIYMNRFEDQAEAEVFIVQFRKDYPMYENAWLLKHKD